MHVLNSFFLVVPVRRCGLGLQFARTVIDANPGRWTVAFQDANAATAHFWPKLAAQLDPDWTRKHLPVPDRPDLPPEAWVTFTGGGSHDPGRYPGRARS